MPSKTIGLRIDEAQKARLDQLGKRRDRAPNYLINQAITQFLDKEEAVEAERQVIRDRWDRYTLTGETLSHDDVTAWAKGLGSKG